MSKVFHSELDILKNELIRMAGLSTEAVHKSVRALKDRDLELAEEVMHGDTPINILDKAIDRQSLKLLALGQPMAVDLRFIVGGMRMSKDIERIGDEARDMAEHIVFLAQRPAIPESRTLTDFLDLTDQTCALALRALADLDRELALKVYKVKPTSKTMFMKVFREMTEFMVSEARAVERAIQVSFIAHSLKRICGRCVNIAEGVIFILEGENVKDYLRVAAQPE